MIKRKTSLRQQAALLKKSMIVLERLKFVYGSGAVSPDSLVFITSIVQAKNNVQILLSQIQYDLDQGCIE